MTAVQSRERICISIMETYQILKDLAIVFICAKGVGLLARKCKAPMVVGEIIAGLLIGPCLLGIVQPTDFINKMAEIGVVLIMFSAGLETNLQELKKSGLAACMIACVGVLVPLVGGSLLYMGMQLAVSLGFIYLCPNTIVAHWIYLVAAGAVLAIAYVLFKMKYYHLHEEYLASLGK